MSSALPKSTSASASAESKAPISVGDENTEGKKKIEAKIEAIEAKIETLEAQLKNAEEERDLWKKRDINSLQYKDAKEEVLRLTSRINKEEDQLHDLREKEKLLLQLRTSSSVPSPGKSPLPSTLCPSPSPSCWPFRWLLIAALPCVCVCVCVSCSYSLKQIG